METMQLLSKTDVLICGLGGLGVEVAKNLILAGPHAVHLWDPTAASSFDLSSQFYLSKESFGKSRAACSVKELGAVNANVKVDVLEGALSEENLKKYHVVVFCNSDNVDEVERVSEFCHANKIKFINAESKGLFGTVFVDMGEDFVIRDVDGEDREAYTVTAVEPSEVEGKTRITIAEGSRIEFQTGASVVLRELRGEGSGAKGGIEALNETEWTVEVIGAHVADLPFPRSDYGKYLTGGVIQEVKKQKKVSFKSFKESQKAPGEYSMVDWSKMDRPPQCHVGWQALRQFRKSHGSFPAPGNVDHQKEVVALAKEINAAAKIVDGDLDEKIISLLADGSSGELNPMAAYLGGMVAQEAVKSTGKFHPIFQWYYFDAAECAPELNSVPVAERQPKGERYDSQVAVFGQTFQDKLQSLQVFLVGAGALGCELLKNFGCIGIGTKNGGNVQVTDLDSIEKSNLNRQFLFRPPDVGAMKSVCAARTVKGMNPELNVHAHETPVGKDTEDVFDDNFWEPLDIVVNGLDNIQARLYVDERCVEFKKPLLESGTLGTKANSQVVLPFLTENYGASKDPPEKQIAVCTEKHFPFKIEHTIQFAKNNFNKTFFEIPTDMNHYVEQDDYVKNLLEQNPSANIQREKLEGVKQHLERIKKGVTFLECITLARLDFEEQFSNMLKQLLFNFPADAKTRDGNPFWAPPKRPPVPQTFAADNETHMDFVVACANLYAAIYGVKERSTDRAFFAKALAGVQVPEYQPKSGVKIKEKDEDQIQEGADDDANAVQALLSSLPEASWFKGRLLDSQEFEKDDDSNHHIDYIAAAANLRANNYQITNVTRHQVKGIAGKIIPAVATTTCMITGLVCFELYKVFQKKPLDHFKNAFVNLAIPLAAFSEPLAPAQHKSQLEASNTAPAVRCVPENWTVWDTIDIFGDVTVEELIKIFEAKHSASVGAIASGQYQLYQPFFPSHKERLPKKITDVWMQVNKQTELPKGKNYLELVVIAEDAENDEIEVDLPVLRVYYKQDKAKNQ
jgi:ubiquitin-activating enzyme E1